MGVPGWLNVLGGVGSLVAAPFTAGTSLAWLPAALAGAAGVGGALGNRKSARTGTYTPIENPAYATLQDTLIKQNLGRLNAPTALPAGYLEGGIQNINRTTDLGNQNLENRLTAMGLSNSPVAANAFGNAGIARAGAINTFQNIEAPAFEQQLRQQDLGNALNLFGQRRTGTEVVQPGSALGAGFSDAASLLAYLYGKGRIGGGGTKKGRTPTTFPPMNPIGIPAFGR